MRTAATLIVATSLLAAPPALAAAWQVGDNAFHVTFNDLDLQSAAGRAQALKRFEGAAERLCGTSGVRSEHRACVAQVMKASMLGHSHPMLELALRERESQGVSLAMGK